MFSLTLHETLRTALGGEVLSEREHREYLDLMALVADHDIQTVEKLQEIVAAWEASDEYRG